MAGERNPLAKLVVWLNLAVAEMVVVQRLGYLASELLLLLGMGPMWGLGAFCVVEVTPPNPTWVIL
eukprot:12883661-Prorocentrum_lima.AAC.1